MTYFDDNDDLLGFSEPAPLPRGVKSKSRKGSSRNSAAAPREGTAGGRVETFQDIPAETTEAALAGLLGINSSRVRTLARDGVLVRSGRGKFDFSQSLRNYLSRLREHAERAGRPSVGGDALKEEKLKLTAAQREAQEMKNAVAHGELVSADDAQRAWASILVDVRAGVLAIPSRLPELTPEQKVQLDLELRLALERLSNG